MFAPDVSHAVATAPCCRVAVYPAVPGWAPARTLLEVADCPEHLGETLPHLDTGHWLIVGIAAEQARAEAQRLRGSPVALIWLDRG
ncbi:hypothetical protein ACL00X_11140 [Aeromonas diversa]|uniref:hypothetical protein n=1 Tax=Aeromonas diversa TaxID=502790 RepID=UPI0039A10A91